MDLETPLTNVKGVGPARAALLEAKGLVTVEDLLAYVPFRYEDRSNVKTIAQLAPGEMATVIASVHSAKLSGFKRRNLGMFEARFTDASRAILVGKWFHGGYLANVLADGMRVALFGKVEFDSYSGELTMLHPEFEILSGDEEGDATLHVGRVVPIYEGIGKITTRQLRIFTHRILGELGPIEDPLPEHLRARFKLPDRATAIREAHFPPPESDLRLFNAFRSQAQFRLIFEEFFWLECGVALKRSKARTVTGIAFEINAKIRERVRQMLPFRPTGAQKRVIQEIVADMREAHPMNRLLQGDVGSGKTIVAAQAAVIAVENGYQAVLLAPTEILAAQHFLNLQRIFKPLDYRVMPLTGSMSKKEKETIKRSLSTGFAQIAVGTHALLEQDVEFHKLGLAIIDEQHRFGVLQRKALQQKGFSPDVLVMTATPIPRTLALTIYGDLDVSVIDGLPPGRKPIQTIHKTRVELEQVYSFVLSEVRKGRQAYIVYPAIEESETVAMKAAQEAYEELSRRVFPQLKVGLLHGKLPAKEKEAVMAAFQRGVVQVLVTTTVIEVGVDVPNASVMVIEDAERFGLAQIHQLRGRVGRGSEQSYCVLVTSKLGDVGYARIRTLLDSSDGFYIAEMDLRLRGPGEFLGTKQSGLPVFRIGNLIRDSEILELARGEAQSLVLHPPSPEILEHAVNYVRQQWQRRYGLALVG